MSINAKDRFAKLPEARKEKIHLRAADMSSGIPIHESSGNVFADLGIENPEELLAESNRRAALEEIAALGQEIGDCLPLETQQALKEIKEGHLTQYEDEFDMFRKLGI